ncbi:MAG TPA: hypothetical protein VHL11_06885 [Phototrophicaceae bacterium]|nr:hypothetical protein [Phototrophicaceae bacterium]
MGFNPVGGNLLIITSASMQHWNPVTQEKVFEIIYEDSLIDGGWNPSGTQFIVLNGGFANAFGSDGLVIDLHRLGVDSLHLSFSSFDWNWDGSSIVLGLDNGAIYVWNIAKETVSTVFTGHNFKVDTISHNPFNNLVASGDDNGTLLIWNPDTGRIIWTLTGHTSAVNDLAWSPDGRGLASASTDGTVIVWDVITGKPITTFDYGAPVRAVAWSPKGGQIVFGGDALPGTTPEPRFETVPDSTFSPALPLPNAGDDQTITGDGRSALVTLDGLNSIDVDGAVTSYIWVEAGSIIATGAQPQVKLSVGTHTITLTVSDNDHQLASDEVIISVFPTAVPSPSSTP